MIRAEKLTKYYGRIRAVNNLDLTVSKGDCVGLLGPNGAGKTTTIKIFTGMLLPSGGRAYIRGIDVVDDPEEALVGVGALVESPELYPEVSPRKLLRFLGRLRGLYGAYLDERIRIVIKQVGMEDWIDVPIGRFSRGMKQRIAIAQAILHDPEILFLDEPSLGLDPKGIVEIRGLIRDLHKSGKTILLASHLLGEVQQICNKVALINKGELIMYSDIDEISSMLGSAIYEVRVLDPVNREVLGDIERMEFVTNVRLEGEKKLVVGVKGGDDRAYSLLLYLIRDLGLRVSEFRRSMTMLESLYMELVEEVS